MRVGKTIGVVTAVQSPRSDVVPAMAAILGAGVRVLELGALDGPATMEELAAVARQAGDTPLVCRRRDAR
jgi:protein AroM